MKAAVCKKYGSPDQVSICEVPTPNAKDSEILVRILATTVSSADSRIRSAKFPLGFATLGRLALGLFGPRKQILGTELVGVVESIGSKVTKFQVGDTIIAFVGILMGTHAEYLAIPENKAIVKKPASLSTAEAAAFCFGGATALFFLKDKAKLRAGETVLVVGASGAVGSAAVQLAKSLGGIVTGVCSSPNLELVRKLGADFVIDYEQTKITKLAEAYDIIFDTTGNLSGSDCKDILKADGRLILIAASLPQMLEGIWKPLGRNRKVIAGSPAPERIEDLLYLADLSERGKYRPLVDCEFPFESIVQAHSIADSGRKKGSVVIRVTEN